MNRRISHVALAGLSLSLAHAASATVIWNESVNGDLSTDRLNPTPLGLTLGDNSISGAVISGDRDYVALTVPAGQQLAHIFVASFAGNTSLSFIGVQQGTQMTVDPAAPDVALLLGYTHFGLSTIGTDIMPAMGIGAGAAGFSPPLASGTYTFWIQETSANQVSYTFNFQTVPTPGAGGVVLLGMGAGLRRRRVRGN